MSTQTVNSYSKRISTACSTESKSGATHLHPMNIKNSFSPAHSKPGANLIGNLPVSQELACFETVALSRTSPEAEFQLSDDCEPL